MARWLAYEVAVLAGVAVGSWWFNTAPVRVHPSSAAAHSTLPAPSAAVAIVNATHHHGEWVNLPMEGSVLRAFLVYPERSDKAPAVIVSGKDQGASDWVRSVATQLASDGFLAVVPDVFIGHGTAWWRY
jgi:carboxymethylenebutenolidase